MIGLRTLQIGPPTDQRRNMLPYLMSIQPRETGRLGSLSLHAMPRTSQARVHWTAGRLDGLGRAREDGVELHRRRPLPTIYGCAQNYEERAGSRILYDLSQAFQFSDLTCMRGSADAPHAAESEAPSPPFDPSHPAVRATSSILTAWRACFTEGTRCQPPAA
jgi:hypothetical protein